MAKGAWIGIDGKAKKIKNMYIGIDGKAKKIKKAWIGVDGKAKLFFSSDAEVKFNQTLSATVTSDSYNGYGNGFGAIFKRSPSSSSSGYFYNTSLTRSTFSATRTAEGNILTGNSAYLFVAGGCRIYVNVDNGSDTWYTNVDMINSSGTKSAAGALGTARSSGRGGTFQNAAFVIGGHNNQTSKNSVDTYDTSGTRTSRTGLSAAKQGHAVATLPSYILISGGFTKSDTILNTVDVYNSSFTRSSATNLPVKKSLHGGASNSTYAVFAGGVSSGRSTTTSANTVATTYAYNNSLTVTTAASLPSARNSLRGESHSDAAIFVGGYIYQNYKDTYFNDVITYDNSLTMADVASMSVARYGHGTAIINNRYLLAAGGVYGEDDEGRDLKTGKVDVFDIA